VSLSILILIHNEHVGIKAASEQQMQENPFDRKLQIFVSKPPVELKYVF